MNVFDVWLIIVGLVIGAGLAWLVMLDLRRRDDDLAAGESRAEAAWIADTLRRQEIAADAEAVEEVLRLHRAYLAGIPDDGAWSAAPAAAGAGPVEGGERALEEEIPSAPLAAYRPVGAGQVGAGQAGIEGPAEGSPADEVPATEADEAPNDDPVDGQHPTA